MEVTNRTILRDFRSNIVNDLEPNDTLPDLSSVLTPKDDAEIKAQSTRQGRCEKLLEILPRKGPNAFKVFVEALKKEAPHLADVLIEADKGTDKELRYAGEQSANRQIRDLKTKLEAEKQDHAKTSKELEELKCFHETFKTDTSEQIQKLAKFVRHLTGNSCSSGKALRNLRDSTERETQASEIRELTKGIIKMTELYRTFETLKREYRSLQKKYRNLSQEPVKAKKLQLEGQDKSKEVELKLKKDLEKSQRDLEESKADLANKNERLKEYQQKSKTIDELDKKLKNAMENKKSLQKKLSEEISKCNTLKKEINRLNQMLGQIYSYSEDFDKRETNHGKTSQVNPSSTEIRELEIGQRVKLRRLPEGLREVNLSTRACARQLRPCAVVVASRTPKWKSCRCVENCPPCMLPRKPQRRRVNRCK